MAGEWRKQGLSGQVLCRLSKGAAFSEAVHFLWVGYVFNAVL
jgi:hypothetical protein